MPAVTEDFRDSAREPFRVFIRMLGVPWWEYFFLFLLFLLKMAPQLLLPLVIAESIRMAGSGADDPWHTLAWVYGGYLAILLANIPLHLLFVRRTSRITRTAELRLRSSMLRRLQQLSMDYHGERETGRLQAKVLRDVDEIIRFAEVCFLVSTGAVIGVVFAFGYTLAKEPLVALGYLIATPLCIGLIRMFRDSMARRNDSLRREVEGMSQRIGEMLQMVPVTRAHGAEEAELDIVHGRLKHVRERGSHVDLINAYFGSGAFVVFMATIVAITAGVTWLVTEGHISIDKIALYTALFQMVVNSVQQLLGMLPQISRALASIRSVGEVLECPDIEANDGKLQIKMVRGEIEFREVTFRYRSTARPAISEFSLHVHPGTCVAFVGESGSGKSTLMQLAIGFLRADSGEILLDGLPLESIDMRSWRRHIAMVPQQTILFSGTIRENIAYGLPDYTDEAVWDALDIANLREIIANLPAQLDTRIGENGVKLSGGQRQRLAIARAVIRNPSVIIFDEATSALDVISEREVQIAITNLIHGRTTFIVAHRLSTVRQADQIVVLREGRLIEAGPPGALEAAGGAFSLLKSLQNH